jgi:lysophospholipase L1-like esterase
VKRQIKRGCLGSVLILLVIVVAALAFAFCQGRRTPDGRPEYVALGSSFAAGAGLGRLQEDSPFLCARSVDGYPQRLARMRRLSIVDMSCGGAKTKHLSRGGQFFQGPQVRVIGPETRLVTVTVGGNDVGYVGDLSMLAARNSTSLFGRFARGFWGGPQSRAQRNYAAQREEMIAALRDIHVRAPEARIVVATYPTLLPPGGTCRRLGLSETEAALMRRVGDDLAAITRSAAKQGGALLVDMHILGAAHHVCSASPWVNGWSNGGVAPFHPNPAGAKATAEAVSNALGR